MIAVEHRHFEQIDSTMAEAGRRIQHGLRAPLVITAGAQTGGHGRYGRTWASPPGNVYWTAAVPTQAAWPQDHTLALSVGLAVVDTLVDAGVARHRVSLKWPNDALIDARKVAGILIHVSRLDASASPPGHLTIGIGVNVNSHPPDTLYPATSIVSETRSPADPATVAAALTDRVFARLHQWSAGRGCGHVREYASLLFGVNESVTVSLDRDRHTTVRGINRGIDEHGALQLELPDGQRRRILAGDVLPA